LLLSTLLSQAYHKKALQLHPDKRKESERALAVEEFNILQKAYFVVCGPAAKAAREAAAKTRRVMHPSNKEGPGGC